MPLLAEDEPGSKLAAQSAAALQLLEKENVPLLAEEKSCSMLVSQPAALQLLEQLEEEVAYSVAPEVPSIEVEAESGSPRLDEELLETTSWARFSSLSLSSSKSFSPVSLAESTASASRACGPGPLSMFF